MPFFETSAKENVNIEHAFSVLIKEILEKVGYFSNEKESGRFFLTDWVNKVATTEYFKQSTANAGFALWS